MASTDILTRLVLEISSNSADLKKGLADANNSIDGFKDQIGKIGGLIAGAFEIGAIVAFSKKVFDMAQQFGEATDKVQEFSDLSGKSLRDVTASIKATSDTFGQDFNSVLKTTNELSKQTGLSFKDSSDLIQKGLVLNHNNGEEFLSLMQSSIPILRDVGLSGSESIALLTNSLRQGIGQDAVTAIMKASKNLTDLKQPAAEALAAIGISGEGLQERITNGSITTFQAIQEISNRLKQLPPQSQEVSAVLDDVFGKGARSVGIGFIESLGQMKTDMNDLIGEMSEAQQAQLKLVEANQDLDGVWESMFSGSAVGWTNLKADLTEIAAKTLIEIRDGTIDIINYFITLYNNSVLFRAVIQDLVLQFKTLWDAVKLVGGLLIDTFVNAGRVVKDVFTLNFKDIVPAYEDAIKKVINRTADFGKDVVTNFKQGVDNTLNNKPIALIDLNKAEQQGVDAAKAFSKGLASGGDDSTKKGDKGGDKDQKFKIPKYDDNIDAIKSNIASKLAADFQKLKPVVDGATKSVKELQTAGQKFGESFQKDLQERAYSSVVGLGESLADTATSGKANLADLANQAEQSAKTMVKSSINTAIAGAVSSAFQLPYPLDIIIAPLLIAAADSFINMIPGFANGGLVDGSSPFIQVGERGSEIIQAPVGSRVYNNQDSNMMLNRSGSGKMQIEITGRLSGTDILLSQKEVTRRRSNSI